MNTKLILLLFLFSGAVLAEEVHVPSNAPAPAAPAQNAPQGAEEVRVDQIKRKYWAGGDSAQVGVVQNRAYSKAGKFSLGINGGIVFADPFLSTKILGGTFGYNFSEYLALELIGWKLFANGSSALETLRDQGKDANTNLQKAYYGTEVLWSVMYGKLSFIGRKIIYYDLHLTAGGGMIDTETGKYPAGTLGIGQRFYLSQSFSLRLDYRSLIYQEHIAEKVVTSQLGQDRGTRTNFGHTIVLGIDLFFGGGGGRR